MYFYFLDYELAHSKSATQYPTFESYTASLAVDWNLDTFSWAADGGGSTRIAWWQVDLGGIYQVNSLLLYNTGDSYGKAIIMTIHNTKLDNQILKALKVRQFEMGV